MGTCCELNVSRELTAEQLPLCLRQESWFEILLRFQQLKSYEDGNPVPAHSLYLKMQYLGIRPEC